MPTRVWKFALFLCIPSWLIFGQAAFSLAHEIRPAVATLALEPGARFELSIVVNIEAVIAGIGAQHRNTDESPNAREYNRLRALPPEALRAEFDQSAKRYLDGITIEFDGRRVRPAVSAIEIPPAGDLALSRQTTVRLAGAAPAAAKALTFAYAARFGSCVVRVKEGARLDAVWLKDGLRSAPYVPGKGFDQRTLKDVVLDYTALGFTHIVPKGLDHILFVLGLFLLSLRMAPLLIQVTAFTVAHTLTLGLSVYGVVSLSPAVVEPLIAASIAYVAIENVVTPTLKPWRALVVFGFGLLHGMGFAGVLQEIGLPHGQFVPALVSFNVGVELGQLTVILLAFLAVGVWGRNRPWYRPRIVIPASSIIAAVGLFWTVQRVLAG